MKKEKETEKLEDEKLVKVSGGECAEPEEFEWQPEGYQTPVKEPSEGGWVYGPIGNTDGGK